ncbi:hypothetical protein RB213_001189 [Colletotrichum asianum]
MDMHVICCQAAENQRKETRFGKPLTKADMISAFFLLWNSSSFRHVFSFQRRMILIVYK